MTEFPIDRRKSHELWRKFVNPDYVDLLEAFDFGKNFVRAKGTKLFDEDGREYVDFLSGFGVHNLGHNHPRLIDALHAELKSDSPSMLNVNASAPPALVAQKLNEMSHPALRRTVFANSGAEAAEIALKIARAATGRNSLVSCRGGWHGLTAGALSLMDDEMHRRGSAPSTGEVLHIPFDDLSALEAACRSHRPAAFVVEPIQGEGGIRVPSIDYLRRAKAVCVKANCLFIVDEIQTGIGRTGAPFASDFSQATPDVLLLGKALGGGLLPAAACMTTSEIWAAAFSGPQRCNLCASTFAGGRLAMTVALETLNILQEERLAERSAERGEYLLSKLQTLAGKHDIIREVRGRGLFVAVEFHPPRGTIAKIIPQWARQGIFAQVVSAILLRDHGILTQTCGLAPTTLRAEPPLVVSREEIDAFCAALDATLTAYPTYNSAAIAAVRKTVLRRKL